MAVAREVYRLVFDAIVFASKVSRKLHSVAVVAEEPRIPGKPFPQQAVPGAALDATSPAVADRILLSLQA